MNLALAAYLHTILANIGDYKLAERNLAQDTDDMEDIPCIEEITDLAFCVYLGAPSEEESEKCLSCFAEAEVDLDDVVTCEDVQSMGFCDQMDSCLDAQCAVDCMEELSEVRGCLSDVLDCDLCGEDEGAFSIA